MPARVLVAYGSRMGATAEIARAIGQELRSHGVEADVLPARAVDSVQPYRFVVVGSAIYAGRWRRDALALLKRHQLDLMRRQVWLFQSGLSVVAQARYQDPTPSAVHRLAAVIGANTPVTFPGRLTRESARGLVPRLMARQPGAGDYRDWERIRRWAAEIAMQVRQASPGGPVTPTGGTR
jgi:menaquinone-dependent protoporphyrinogen oxidase